MRSQRKRATAATISAVLKTLRLPRGVELGVSNWVSRYVGRRGGISGDVTRHHRNLILHPFFTRIGTRELESKPLVPSFSDSNFGVEHAKREGLAWLGSRAPSNTRRNSRARFSIVTMGTSCPSKSTEK